MLVYETIIALSVFDLVYVLTGGGPGSATTLFSWFTYTATFKYLNFGQGAALSFMMAAVLLVFILVYMRVVRVQERSREATPPAGDRLLCRRGRPRARHPHPVPLRVSASLQTESELIRRPPPIVAPHPTVDNYDYVFTGAVPAAYASKERCAAR